MRRSPTRSHRDGCSIRARWRGFNVRAKHERIVVAGIPILLVIIVVAVASGGGGGNTYPTNVQASFQKAARRNGTVARCECELSYVEAGVPLNKYQAEESAIEG